MGVEKKIQLLIVLAIETGVISTIQNENLSEVTDLLGNGSAQFKIVNTKIMSESSYHNAQDLTYRSLDFADTLPLPVSIEVQLGSKLNIETNQPAVIKFQVTNNRLFRTWFTFNAGVTGYTIQNIYPRSVQIERNGQTTVQVTIGGNSYDSRNANGGLVTFGVGWRGEQGDEYVSLKVYVRTGSLDYDSWGPSIWYDYESDCTGWLDPDKCDGKTWKINVSIQDDQSGILSLKSEPVGLTLRQEFIVGTKDEIRGYYSASCCHTKVDIFARDLNGNSYLKYIDVERRWLSIGEISAIVLGCVLILIIIALIVWCIVKCYRRKQTLSIYPSRRNPE